LLDSRPGNSPVVEILLHRIGVFNRVWGYEFADGMAVRDYSGMDKNEHFSNYLHNAAEKDPRFGVPLPAKLHAAHLVARLPLLAILGADMRLPKMTQEQNASERPFVDIKLKVDLRKPITVLLSIFVGQLLAIGIVQVVCRKVFVRDYASYLSIARLLKTAVKKVDGMSTQTGKELVEYLDQGDVMMRYGTRQRGEENLEVDLWNDVKNEFPDATYE